MSETIWYSKCWQFVPREGKWSLYCWLLLKSAKSALYFHRMLMRSFINWRGWGWGRAILFRSLETNYTSNTDYLSLLVRDTQPHFRVGISRGLGLNPHFMSVYARFWVKIGFKFQSLCKISKISTSDPLSFFLHQFQHCPTSSPNGHSMLLLGCKVRCRENGCYK